MEGKGQKKGDTYHHMLGGPIGDVWNTPGYEKDVYAMQKCNLLYHNKAAWVDRDSMQVILTKKKKTKVKRD